MINKKIKIRVFSAIFCSFAFISGASCAPLLSQQNESQNTMERDFPEFEQSPQKSPFVIDPAKVLPSNEIERLDRVFCIIHQALLKQEEIEKVTGLVGKEKGVSIEEQVKKGQALYKKLHAILGSELTECMDEGLQNLLSKGIEPTQQVVEIVFGRPLSQKEKEACKKIVQFYHNPGVFRSAERQVERLQRHEIDLEGRADSVKRYLEVKKEREYLQRNLEKRGALNQWNSEDTENAKTIALECREKKDRLKLAVKGKIDMIRYYAGLAQIEGNLDLKGDRQVLKQRLKEEMKKPDPGFRFFNSILVGREPKGRIGFVTEKEMSPMSKEMFLAQSFYRAKNHFDQISLSEYEARVLENRVMEGEREWCEKMKAERAEAEKNNPEDKENIKERFNAQLIHRYSRVWGLDPFFNYLSKGKNVKKDSEADCRIFDFSEEDQKLFGRCGFFSRALSSAFNSFQEGVSKALKEKEKVCDPHTSAFLNEKFLNFSEPWVLYPFTHEEIPHSIIYLRKLNDFSDRKLLPAITGVPGSKRSLEEHVNFNFHDVGPLNLLKGLNTIEIFSRGKKHLLSETAKFLIDSVLGEKIVDMMLFEGVLNKAQEGMVGKKIQISMSEVLKKKWIRERGGQDADFSKHLEEMCEKVQNLIKESLGKLPDMEERRERGF